MRLEARRVVGQCCHQCRPEPLDPSWVTCMAPRLLGWTAAYQSCTSLAGWIGDVLRRVLRRDLTARSPLQRRAHHGRVYWRRSPRGRYGRVRAHAACFWWSAVGEDLAVGLGALPAGPQPLAVTVHLDQSGDALGFGACTTRWRVRRAMLSSSTTSGSPTGGSTSVSSPPSGTCTTSLRSRRRAARRIAAPEFQPPRVRRAPRR